MYDIVVFPPLTLRLFPPSPTARSQSATDPPDAFGFPGSARQRVAQGWHEAERSSEVGPATCLTTLPLLALTHNSRFSAGLHGQRTNGAFQLPGQTAALHFTVQGPRACLPPCCFISANLITVYTHEMLAIPSATRTVCITLKSSVQPNSLVYDTQEACWQYIVQACIMQQLKKSTPGHGLPLHLLSSRHHKSHRQKLCHSTDVGHTCI